MTYSSESFNKFCHDAAQQFLQTVVVIDNEAVFHKEKKGEIKEQQELPSVNIPSAGTLKKTAPKAKSSDQITQRGKIEKEQGDEREPDEESPNILYAKPLIDKFADDGIICSVMRPDPDEDQVIERAVTVASVADILVVDWMLGKIKGDEKAEDFRAKEIIKGVIELDLKKRGRLRLIAVYTAEPNPGTTLDDLYEHIKDLDFPDGKITKTEDNFTLHNQFLKIAILLKPTAGEHLPGQEPIQFDNLPDKLQMLFSDLNCGLLPSITLRSIAAIREETHHLLAVLHSNLDAALVGHRCLLPHPQDVEEFCEDLVAGELRSILSMGRIGINYAGETANKAWVGSKMAKEVPLSYEKFQVYREHIFSLVKEGQDGHKKFLAKLRVDWLERTLQDNPKFEDKDGNPIDLEVAKIPVIKGEQSALLKYKIPPIGINGIPQILCGDEKKGEKINVEFSRICSFKREAVGLRQPTINWMPRLTLGTVLQEKRDAGDRFLICLQPRCESVRFIKKEKCAFPFLIIGKGKKKEFICFNAFDDNDKIVEKALYYEAKPKNQVVFEFESVTGDVILSQKENDLYLFKDTSGEKDFIWLGDLKDFLAQNIVDNLSSVVGSVGFNPYEWQRRKCK